ncbi:uncharacterized protein [Watersipora subatra]|uniref:uncharacterized protein n=1 Tax=Watersipora subatra TaxID=2589382 RepID=UPI00355B0A75
MYNSNNHRESLEHANDWLTKRLQLTEEQVREGEEVNATLTEENRHLKTAKTVLNAKLDDLTSELEQLQTSVQDYSAEKQSLLSNIGSLEQEVSVLRQEDENAKHLADELKSEMERMQDMVASRAQEVEDMRLYISQLEDRNERQEERSETQLAAMYQALSEKDEYITQMQRNLNDMEASLLTKGSTPADISKSLAIEMVEDDNICFSSPVEVKGSVEYLRNKLADGASSINELQMKLETVQVANEIYQEEVKDLQCRLETSLQTPQNSLSEVTSAACSRFLCNGCSPPAVFEGK